MFMTRTAYRLLTATALALAAAGLLLPLLPTTPFVLVAAWSASRHSPALEAKLLAHPSFGPPLRAWRADGALSRRSKCTALVALAVSFVITFMVVDSGILKAVAGAVLAVVGSYLATRPEPAATGSTGVDPVVRRCDG
jgi:uncharacterized protein